MVSEPWIDSKQASKHLGSSADWLVANIQKLQIPHSRLGRQYRFRLTELDGWIRNHFDSNEEGVLNV
jgi:excisionase family DNA binding protein